ncbi:MAG TPA: right-handed parallel beta-helix repeat-containing protein [Thermoanaerobaculia bacterium]|jgi:hypothetical protein|nr:right-handed parallel beta-helix repeat-containing protein [Thermoanaerobaculia bacterium]
MKDQNPGMRFAVVAALVLATTSLANAQAARTWVSGVGDDANPCSRTAPCKTFAGAISKTAACGEINTLDPGGFGGVIITKCISIEAEGGTAGVAVSGTYGIIINAGAADTVVLRGLDFEGLGTGLAGVKIISAGAVHIENCRINNFVGNGSYTGAAVDASPGSPTTNLKLSIKDTVIRDNRGSSTYAVLIGPSTGTTVNAVLDHVKIEDNYVGLRVEDGGTVTVRDSSISNNLGRGVVAASVADPAVLNLVSTSVSGNLYGVVSRGTLSQVRISHASVFDNDNVGLYEFLGGKIVSFGNNQVIGNGTDGAPTSKVAQQ